MWLAVSAGPERREGIEQVLPQLASIVRFTGELDRRLAGEGLGGLASVRELHRCVVDLLTALAPDVARAQGTVADLVQALGAMQASIEALRRLKSELGRAP